MLYCDACDEVTLAEAGLTDCVFCTMRLCAACSNSHNHTGAMCDDCGYRTLDSDDITYCEACVVYTCDSNHTYNHESCETEEESRMPTIRGMGRVASMEFIDDDYVHHPLALGQRAASVELEVEYSGRGTQRYLTLSPFVGVGRDGSLSDGVEVTTPPCKGAALAKFVTGAALKLSEGGFEVAATCGMHVHIDLRDKQHDTKFLSHLFNAVYAFEDVLFAMQSYDRHLRQGYTHYSMPLRNSYAFYDMYGQKSGDFDWTLYGQPKAPHNVRYLDSAKREHYNNVRYSSFNFHSVYFRGSLECRINQGEIDPERALLWVDLIQAIIARVEKGHSYAFMTKWITEKVTRQKVRAFKRYFGLDDRLYKYVTDRIANGQGWDFALPDPINWGTPVKGRPKGMPVERPRPGLNRMVRCVCGFEFILRDYHNFCDRCDVRFNGTAVNYTVMRRPRRVPRVPQYNWMVGYLDASRSSEELDSLARTLHSTIYTNNLP